MDPDNNRFPAAAAVFATVAAFGWLALTLGAAFAG